MKRKLFFGTFIFLAFAGSISAQTARSVPSYVSLSANDLLETPNTAFVGTDNSILDGFYYKQWLDFTPLRLSHYWSDWGFGGGFTYSNCTDIETLDFNNLSAYAGTGQHGDSYFIANASDFCPVVIEVSEGESFNPTGMYVTNSSFAALAMLHGNAPAKKFGGADGTDPDWFKLIVSGYNGVNNDELAGSVEFYLADYRFENSAEDYIVKDWTWLDLSALGNVGRLSFTIESSDVGDWGINTPTYFCIDSLAFNFGGVGIIAVPEGEFTSGNEATSKVYEDGQYVIYRMRNGVRERYTINGVRID